MDIQTAITEQIQLRACAFTGHRDLQDETLQDSLYIALQSLINQGVRVFYNGGAKGFDLLAAELVLRLKQEYATTPIRLILCVPCPKQDSAYSPADKARYARVLREADEVISLAERYFRGCMQNRDRYMADRADVLVAYLRKDTGGTAYTVRYFTKKYPQKQLVLL